MRAKGCGAHQDHVGSYQIAPDRSRSREVAPDCIRSPSPPLQVFAVNIELLVLPRSGAEYDTALANTWSVRGGGTQRLTLRDNLYGMSTSERVRAQAERARVQRVCCVWSH